MEGGSDVSDENAMEAVRLAVMAAGPMTNERSWNMKVHEAIPSCAALLVSGAAETAEMVLGSSHFRAEYVRSEMEEAKPGNKPSKRMLVWFKSDTTDVKDADDDGTEHLRTEPSYTPAGYLMQKKVSSLSPGQQCVVYKHIQLIDGGRKKVRVLAHLEIIGGQSRSVTPDRPPTSVQAPERTAGDAARPASPATSIDKQIAEIETRYEKLGPVWRVRFAKQCNIQLGVQAALMPPDDKVDDVLRVLDEIETESEKA